jgi:hypothetical protein
MPGQLKWDIIHNVKDRIKCHTADELVENTVCTGCDAVMSDDDDEHGDNEDGLCKSCLDDEDEDDDEPVVKPQCESCEWRRVVVRDGKTCTTCRGL